MKSAKPAKHAAQSIRLVNPEENEKEGKGTNLNTLGICLTSSVTSDPFQSRVWTLDVMASKLHVLEWDTCLEKLRRGGVPPKQ